MLKKYRILIADDDPDIHEFITYSLKKEGYKVDSALNGFQAIELATKKHPDLILLDIMMPGMDGIETCQQIRNNEGLNDVLIVFLTARGEDYSQIAGFDAGGDDYIVKPIKPKLIIKKIESLLRRKERVNNETNSFNSSNQVIEFDELKIFPEKHLVIKNNEEVFLPKKEFKLLMLLTSKPGKVFTRDEIYIYIWGDDIIVGDRTIDVHIRKLREKIGTAYIKTVKGIGYKFENQT
jgi:two-component system, OmpR family, alkaline phosphatase synthesis response regulator PhoP